ncbi:hypothetical protein PBY51_012992 [Eleginops maclovinus]|uniref:Uncharacterized protein n=1 Tax=Eleginops maclovinus TaxID=56733 RepID=A0AAN8ARB1_ELEMC|nr:hypothetical protein PBY51_012992 [Eleginops maclovinus]
MLARTTTTTISLGASHPHPVCGAGSRVEQVVRQANSGLAGGCKALWQREGEEKGGGAVVSWWASSASQTHFIDLLIG